MPHHVAHADYVWALHHCDHFDPVLKQSRERRGLLEFASQGFQVRHSDAMQFAQPLRGRYRVDAGRQLVLSAVIDGDAAQGFKSAQNPEGGCLRKLNALADFIHRQRFQFRLEEFQNFQRFPYRTRKVLVATWRFIRTFTPSPG